MGCTLNEKTFLSRTAVLYFLGRTVMVLSLVFFFPLLLLPFAAEEVPLSLHFILPGTLLLSGGWVLMRLRGNSEARHELKSGDGCLVILLAGLLAALGAAWPVSALSGLDFTRSFFESVSGWTTTGLTVVDVETAPKMLLLFRSSLQLAGGAGTAIFMLSVFSLPVGSGLYRSKGWQERRILTFSRCTHVVAGLLAVYTVVGVLALWAAGMTFFDAVNHTFTAVSTGGFSTRTESIGYWNSPAIEAVLIVLMLLGSLNFLTALLLLTARWRSFVRNAEVKVLVLLLIPAAALLFLLSSPDQFQEPGKQLRVAIFQAVSAITTSGFSTTGDAALSSSGSMLLFILMIIGGGIASTAGGIKQLRVYLLAKALLREVTCVLLPRKSVRTYRITVGPEEGPVEVRQIAESGIYVFLYLAALIAGAFLITLHGVEVEDAVLEYASVLGTVGLSTGVTAVTAPDVVLWYETVGMILGRLEFFVVFIVFTHSVHVFRRRSGKKKLMRQTSVSCGKTERNCGENWGFVER